MRDKHAVAFRDDSEMYYANRREKKLAEVNVRYFTHLVTDFPFCSTYSRNIKFSCQVWTEREALWEKAT